MKRTLSIIVPAYNEEKRIKIFLEQLIKFAKSNLKNYEIILVDDGSIDNTINVIRRETKKSKNVKVISYKLNRGKGFAVKKGIFASKGNLILFIDADGSITPDQIPTLLKKLTDYDVVVGDRSAANSKVKAIKSRKIIGIIFNFYASILFGTKVKDNLCGFKGFHREVAIDLFKNLVSQRWLFDVELFYKIRKRDYTVYNLPINWEHKQGSKIRFIDPFKMLFQLLALRIKLIDK